MSQRSSDGEHEGSRRMKTELLVQMDGLSKSTGVFLLSACNLPWELDSAMLRRLEKRIHIDLPDINARKSMFERWLPQAAESGCHVKVGNLDYPTLAKLTHGYTGSDIHLVCREALMRPLRLIFEKLECVCDQDVECVELEPVTMDDLMAAVKCTRTSTDETTRSKYTEWAAQFGSV